MNIYAIRAGDKFYAGIFAFSGRALWVPDCEDIPNLNVLRTRKTNARLLEARKSEPKAEWVVYQTVDFA